MDADELPASFQISLPGHPFDVTASADQQWIFVSITSDEGKKPGIAVLKNTSGQIAVVRMVPMGRSPSGLVLTHHGDMLIATAGDYVVFFDTLRLEEGNGSPAFQWVARGAKAGCVYANVTSDDKTLFVSDESKQTITVIDLERIRSLGRDSEVNLGRPTEAAAAVIGRIPVGSSPVALTFSKDGRWLFTTSEVAALEWGWPRVLPQEGGKSSQRKVPEGAVVVVDVAKARINPQHCIVARVPAGGSPVRLALSPDGTHVFVSARSSNAVLVFDTAELIDESGRAKPKKIEVGKSPVPIVVVADGKFVIVGNSNRYSTDISEASTLTVLDTSRIGSALNPVVGNIPCGAFPRNFCLAPDGKMLLLTNFRSQSLQVIDVSHISMMSGQ